MKKLAALLVILIIFGFSGRFSTTVYKFPELKFFPKMPVSVSNPVTVEGVNLGRHLFYDPILSSDSNLSCAGCHKQANAFSDSPTKFSVGRENTLMKRNTMALFNLAWYPALFWDGRAASIEDQVSHPMRSPDEMNIEWTLAVERLNRSKPYRKMFADAYENQAIDSVKITNAIAQFLRTLISHQSKYDQVISGNGRFNKDEEAGFVLVNLQTKGDCLHCHTTDADALGTTLLFSNNGLDAVSNPGDYEDKGRGAVSGNTGDNGKFMIPSLRNVAVTAPYMHDGRFNTLEEVLDFYSTGVNQSINIDSKMEFAHRGGAQLTTEEKQQIISFFKTLTDSVFIMNPDFSNPFRNKKK